MAFLRSVLESTSDCIAVVNPDGRLTYMNPLGLTLMEIEDFELYRNRPWESLWPDEEVEKVRKAVTEAAAGYASRFEAYGPTAHGTPKWWEGVVTPLAGGQGEMRRLVAICRDVTEHVMRMQAHEAAMREKELLMQEVHHRVKNSLQLVHSLLTMQARTAASPEAAEQLIESAGRVRTIGAIHDQLCRGDMRLAVGVQDYLAGLAEDIRKGMASIGHDRMLEVSADPVTWSAADVSTLGLIMTELVTNALKHGEGTVTVTFSQPPEGQGVLIVEDEGRNLAADFDPGTGRGLGMRLIRGLVTERGGHLALDPQAPSTRFVVTLPWPRESLTA
jgi:PAS domain S-box-containing protein